MVKASVIIPVYNAEKYLSRCLDSVISQSYKDFEVICVEDQSKDNSLAILKSYSKKDNRVKIIENKENQGAALTRNVGIDVAQGKYIYFIDADDYIDEKYIECMLDRIESTKSDIVLNLSIYTDTEGTIVPYKHPSMPDYNKKGEFFDKISTIHNAPCFIWARLFKKSLLDKYGIRFFNIHADDVAFNTIVNLYSRNSSIFYGENYYYTIHNESLTGKITSQDYKDIEHIKAYEEIYDFIKKHNLLDDRLKLFRVYPFMRVNSKEKFDYYKNFFQKIESNFRKNEKIYNEMEKYFFESVLNTSNFEEYLKNYNQVVTIGFLRRGKKQ